MRTGTGWAIEFQNSQQGLGQQNFCFRIYMPREFYVKLENALMHKLMQIYTYTLYLYLY